MISAKAGYTISLRQSILTVISLAFLSSCAGNIVPVLSVPEGAVSVSPPVNGATKIAFTTPLINKAAKYVRVEITRDSLIIYKATKPVNDRKSLDEINLGPPEYYIKAGDIIDFTPLYENGERGSGTRVWVPGQPDTLSE